MKKLFTLIVMAMMAISANAKVDIDFSAVGTAGETITFGDWEWKNLSTPAEGEPDKTTGDDAGVTYFDASAYDYLCIKYKSAFQGKFFIQTKCKGTVGQWGPEFNQLEGDLVINTAGVLGIKLDDKKNTIFTIAVQPQGGGGDFVIEELYWASEEEYTAAVAANPIVKWVPATKELNLDNATGGWGGQEFDNTTHKANLPADGAGGWWITGDYSDYDYFVFEVEGFVKGGWAQFVIFNQNVPITLEGSFVQVVDISKMSRDTNDKSVFEWGGSNCVIQGGASTSWTWKNAYFATAEYVEENGIKTEAIYGDTQDILPSFGSSGWDAKYDATTKTITITGEDGGGKGWWYGENGVDYSHFDNAVIELYPAATVGGFMKVQYTDDTVEEVEFYPGATCIVAAFNADKKSTIKQIWLQGAKDATFTLSAAFVAVAAATPEAALGTAPIEADTWTVAGTLPLVEKTWDPSDENADMTSEDGVTYTYVKEDLVLEANTNYEFKVVKNHAWGEEYPGSNYVLTVPETAKYKVTITFNAETKEVSATYEKTGEAGPVEHTWSVKGNFNNDDNWEKEYDMTKGDDGKFTVVIKDVKAGKWEFKVRADHDWSIAFPGSNKEVTIEKDNSTVTITFDPSDNSIVVVVDAPSDELEGDTNGDGEVNVADIDIVIEAIGEEYNKAADANGDGEVNVADADFIIERIGGTEE